MLPRHTSAMSRRRVLTHIFAMFSQTAVDLTSLTALCASSRLPIVRLYEKSTSASASPRRPPPCPQSRASASAAAAGAAAGRPPPGERDAEPPSSPLTSIRRRRVVGLAHKVKVRHARREQPVVRPRRSAKGVLQPQLALGRAEERRHLERRPPPPPRASRPTPAGAPRRRPPPARGARRRRQRRRCGRGARLDADELRVGVLPEEVGRHAAALARGSRARRARSASTR